MIKNQEFSHLGADATPQMVNVSEKPITQRMAKARSIVVLDEIILEKLHEGDIKTKKGPVFQTAILAGIMAAKKTSSLIPLCHLLPLDGCNISINIINHTEVEIIATVSTSAKTGVEMEALTAVSVAALTIYDMCKSFSHDIMIRQTQLLEKTGGKSDYVKH